MALQPVPVEAPKISRSKKKFVELCKKGVIKTGDILTMEKSDTSGDVITYSAMVGRSCIAIKS